MSYVNINILKRDEKDLS